MSYSPHAPVFDPPETPLPLVHSKLTTLTIAAAATGVIGILAIGSTSADVPVLCVFRRCTGGYCPGCGGTRAVAAMARGDVSGAWLHHPWVVLLAVQMVGFCGAVLSGRLTRMAQLRNRVVTLNIALGLTIWIVRLIVGDIPAPGLPFL